MDYEVLFVVKASKSIEATPRFHSWKYPGNEAEFGLVLAAIKHQEQANTSANPPPARPPQQTQQP